MPTLYDKLWSTHVVAYEAGGVDLLYIDRMLLHEVSSPQAFAGLHEAGRKPRRAAPHLAVADHAVPTHDRGLPIADPQARAQVSLLEANCAANGIEYLPLTDVRQGIVHVIGPEQGFTLPGTTLVCGTAILRPMARSGRWRSALGVARPNACSRRRRCARRRQGRCA